MSQVPAKLSKSEELYLANISHKQEIRKIVLELANQYGISVTDFVILGGRPYITTQGLNKLLQKKIDSEGLILKEITTELLQEPTHENEYMASYKATIVLFNEAQFTCKLDALTQAGPVTAGSISELKSVYTRIYSMEGHASPEDCAAIAFEWKRVEGKQQKQRGKVLPDMVKLQAERRATNRAKRELIKWGTPTLDEMPMTQEAKSEVDAQVEASKDQLEEIAKLRSNTVLDEKTRKLIDKEMNKDEFISEKRAEKIIKRIKMIISEKTSKE